jgi:hypothetical protein
MKTSSRLFALTFIATAASVLAALDGCAIDDRCIRNTDCASGLACVAGSCTTPIATVDDAGLDGSADGATDSGASDASATDGATDSGASDASATDGAADDAASSDAGAATDATVIDAGVTPDAGPADAASNG